MNSKAKSMLSDVHKKANLLVIENTKALLNVGKYQSCVRCEYFSESLYGGTGQNHCAMFNGTPPALVIVTGCEEFEGSIPF